jgi:multidrug resistance efflux pump
LRAIGRELRLKSVKYFLACCWSTTCLVSKKVDQVIAMVDADWAAIETAQTNLEYTSIVAPSDGRMGVRMIDPGNRARVDLGQHVALFCLACA